MKPLSSQRTLRFCGAAGTVTGSKFLFESHQRRVLIDCGLFQGLKELRLRNWNAPPFDPATIDAVVLSHAHIDHSGFLPILVKRGFRGAIHCTPATADLLPILLLDAAHLQEEEAQLANRLGYSKHKPARPLFTAADAEAALDLLIPCAYGQARQIVDGIDVLFRRAGHILGSATVELQTDGWRLVSSGDLGRWDRPILRDPEFVPNADVLLVESTYGDRSHAPDAAGALAQVVGNAERRGGALIIPAFAVGRTQELIWTLRQLEDAKRIPSLPVFVDSPMAINVTDVYCRHPEDHDLEMAQLMDAKRCPLCCRNYHLVRKATESKALNERPGAMIIIAGSGMATGGRVLHHLEHRLPDERTTVLLPGFQAAGTRGRRLQEGEREIRMHGRNVPVRAAVVTLDGFSAHADRNEIMRWLAGFTRPPRQTFIVHGEPQAAQALAETVQGKLGWNVTVAQDGATVSI